MCDVVTVANFGPPNGLGLRTAMADLNPPPNNVSSHPSDAEFLAQHSSMPDMMAPSWFPMLPPQHRNAFWSSASQPLGFALSGMQAHQDISQQTSQTHLPSPLASLPPILRQEVLRLSVAIQSSPENDQPLVKALQDSAINGDNYKTAIERLHGVSNRFYLTHRDINSSQVNDHSAHHWKDYYLEHKARIDNLVSRPRQLQNKTVKKPSPSSFAPLPRAAVSENGDSARSSSHAPHKHRGRSDNKRRHPNPSLPILKSTKRATINSLTAYAPLQNVRNLTPPHAELKVPDPPSRSPTPPSRVVASQKGNKFTTEDVAFLHKFISYELKCNPDLTKFELSEKLAEKANDSLPQPVFSYLTSCVGSPPYCTFMGGLLDSPPRSSGQDNGCGHG
jgi:hypothetical protein